MTEMLFLIDYHRRSGKIISMRTFEDAKRSEAYQERFELERQRNQEGAHHEVVLLEAASEDVIRQTHSRYFDSLPELVRTAHSDGQ
jgi:hypothetical protein